MGTTPPSSRPSRPGTARHGSPAIAPETAPAPAGGEVAGGRRPRLPSWLRWELCAFLELCALCGFAIAQPLLEVSGRRPDLFVSLRADARDIALLVVAVTLLPPLALWALGAASILAGGRARRAAQVALVGAASALLALTLGKRLTPLHGPLLVASAVLAAAALTVLYVRLAVIRQLLRLAAIGPLVFALLFLLTSPTSALVLPQRSRPTVVAPSGAAAPGRHPPIVWLELDEFPLVSLLDGHGRIDARRYPNFAWLAQHSTWYRNATGVSAWTPFAMPAMLTGRYPYKAVAAHYSEYPDNLFTLFAHSYKLNVHETISLLCPPRNCGVADEPPKPPPGAGGGLRAALKQSAELAATMVSPSQPRQASDPPKPKQPRVSATFRFNQLRLDQVQRLRQFLGQLRPSATPRMDFLHLLLPHAPFHYLPSGTGYAIPGSTHPVSTIAKRSTDAWWSQLGHDRHLLQVAWTDRALGEFLRTLRERGLLDSALLVVTADHGTSFRPAREPRRLHPDKRNAADLLWVPLFIKAPRQQDGRVDDRAWEHVDLLPTIADLAGIQVPWQMDGLSALRPQRRERPERYYYDVPRQRLLVDGPRTFAAVLRASPRVVSPAPGLLGRRIDGLPPADPAGPTAEVEKLDAFRSVQPGRQPLPTLVYGTVSRSVPRGALLAIAVNGRVGAVAPALRDPDDGLLRFAGIVSDERLFVPGANRLDVLLLRPDGKGLRRMELRQRR